MRSAQWDGILVEGAFNAVRTLVFGSVDLGHAEIQGSVFMQGTKIGLGPYKGRLFLRQSRIDGDLEVYPWVKERARWLDELIQEQAMQCGIEKINTLASKKWFAMTGSWSGALEKSSHFPQFTPETTSLVKSWKDWIDKHLIFDGCAVRSVIFGSLTFGASEIQGRVNIRGIRIHEALHGITAHVHNRILADCWIHPDRANQQGSISAPLDRYRTEIGDEQWLTSPQTSDGTNKVLPPNQNMRGIILEDAVIDHAVIMRGISCVGEIRLDNIKIGGKLDFGVWWPLNMAGKKPHWATRIRSVSSHDNEQTDPILSIKNAKIGASLILDGAEIAGRIDANSCDIGASVFIRAAYDPEWEMDTAIPPTIGTQGTPVSIGLLLEKSIECYGATVHDNLDLSGAIITGGVDISYIRLGGSFTINRHSKGKSAEIGRILGGESLKMYGARIGGNVCIELGDITGALNLKLARIRGALVCAPAPEPHKDTPTPRIQLGRLCRGKDISFALSLESATIDGGVRLEACTIFGNVYLDNLKTNGSLSLEPHENRFASDQLPNAEAENRAAIGQYKVIILGSFQMRGATIGGGFYARAVELTNFHHGKKWITWGEKLPIFDARVSKIALDARFSGISIAGEVILTDCEFGGEVSFGDPTTNHYLDNNFPVNIWARLSLRRAKIGGTLTLYKMLIGSRCSAAPVAPSSAWKGAKKYGGAALDAAKKAIFSNVVRAKEIAAIMNGSSHQWYQGFKNATEGFNAERLLHMAEFRWSYPEMLTGHGNKASQSDGAAVLDLHQAQISGSLRTTFSASETANFVSDQDPSGFLNSPVKFLLRVNGRTDLEGVKIGGRCLLISALFCGDLSFNLCELKSDCDLSWSAVLGTLRVENGCIMGCAFASRVNRVTWWVLGEINLRNASICELIVELNPRFDTKRDSISDESERDYRFRKKVDQYLAPTEVNLERLRVQMLHIGGALDPRIAPFFTLSGISFEDLTLNIFEHYPNTEDEKNQAGPDRTPLSPLPPGFLTFDSYFGPWERFREYDDKSLNRLPGVVRKQLLYLHNDSKWFKTEKHEQGLKRRTYAKRVIAALGLIMTACVFALVCQIGQRGFAKFQPEQVDAISPWIRIPFLACLACMLVISVIYRELVNLALRRALSGLIYDWHRTKMETVAFGVVAIVGSICLASTPTAFAFLLGGVMFTITPICFAWSSRNPERLKRVTAFILLAGIVLFFLNAIAFGLLLAGAVFLLVSMALVWLGKRLLTLFSKPVEAANGPRSINQLPIPQRLWSHECEYNLLLAQTKEYAEDAYDSVERWLRKSGKDAEANAVYLERSQRELTHGKMKWLAYMLKMISSFTVGSGVRPLGLVLALLGWFAISWIFYSDPRSVEHPPSYVVPLGHAEESEISWANGNKGMPNPSSWGAADGLWVALNVHIPVLHFWARDEWEPSSRPVTLLRIGGKEPLGIIEPSAYEFHAPITYETYASIVQIFTYLAIPFLLIGWANISRRQHRHAE